MRGLSRGELLAVRPLAKIKVSGKRVTGEPFRILRHRGRYFYIPAKTAGELLKINKAYKELGGKKKVRPLDMPKIVGRGGAHGFKPFLVGRERYLCILADDLERLQAVNEAYRELLQRRRAKTKARARG